LRGIGSHSPPVLSYPKISVLLPHILSVRHGYTLFNWKIDILVLKMGATSIAYCYQESAQDCWRVEWSLFFNHIWAKKTNFHYFMVRINTFVGWVVAVLLRGGLADQQNTVLCFHFAVKANCKHPLLEALRYEGSRIKVSHRQLTTEVKSLAQGYKQGDQWRVSNSKPERLDYKSDNLTRRQAHTSLNQLLFNRLLQANRTAKLDLKFTNGCIGRQSVDWAVLETHP
jgi:hypothetical protein